MGISKEFRVGRVLQILISTAILEQGSTTTAELTENGVALEI
jgi:late competence protein required for DNA uptake (superfamily II DNA/RNA helicase)